MTLTEGTKNLTSSSKKQKALQKNILDTKSNLVNFSWHLKTDLGRSDATIRTYTNYLRNISKDGDLNDPDSIKEVIATRYTDKNTKRLACCAYDAYLNFVGGTWKKPSYRPEHKTVFIPTEEELQLAVNSGHKESIVFSKFLYETGARVNEAQRLEWTDLDTERNNVSVKASKNGDSRVIRITKSLMEMLFTLPKNNEKVFAEKPRNSRSSAFNMRMKRLAKIHNNPRFKKIHMHTFRHCKALREYHKTRDILHVMAILGHRKIETSYRYIRLYNQIYKPQQPNQFVTKIAYTDKQAIEFWDNGWTLVDKKGEKRYFRRPKI